MKNDQVKRTIKTVGIVELILGIFVFISSYLTMNMPYDSAGNLEIIVFFGFFGATFFISGTITYLKSLDFLDS